MKTYSELTGNRKKRWIKSQRDNNGPQIKAKGTLQAQEVRQLGEAGIGAWKMLADYLGTTIPDVMDRVQKRMIDSQTALNAILEGMRKRYEGQMEAQSRTFMGRLTVLTTNFRLAMASAIEPVFQKLRDEIFPSLTEKAREFALVAQNMGVANAFRTLLPDPVVDAILAGLNAISNNLGTLRLAFEALALVIGTRFVAGALVPMIGKVTMATQTLVALTRAGVGLSFALETVAAGVFNLGKGLTAMAAFLGSTAGLVTALGIGVGALIGKFWAWKGVLGPVNDELERHNRILEASPGIAGGTGRAGGGGSAAYGVSKEQQLINESRRLEMIEKQRDATLELAQLDAMRASQAAAQESSLGKSLGGIEDKYSKFIQGIKEKARELELAFEVGKISLEEYVEALDRLASTKGLRDVHQLDIVRQKWQALEPVWKQYQESIEKSEEARRESYERGKALIAQWNATEIEMERLKAATKLSIQAEYDQAAFEAGEITQEQLVERKIELENRLYEIEMKALQDRLALGGLEVSERDAINMQILQLQMDHNLKMVQLELQLQQQRKTAMSVTMQEYASTQANLSNMLAEIPARLADAFASAAVGYGKLTDMLRQLVQQIAFAIVKAMLLRAVMGIFGGGIFGGANLGGVMGGFFHGGGIVGKEGVNRFVSLLPRFHSGGLSGDEQLAVLKRGEGVFTPEQMRALGRDRDDDTPPAIVMNINALDPRSFIDLMRSNRTVIESLIVENIAKNASVRKAIRGLT